MRRKKRRSTKEIKSWYEGWKTSGLTQREYCEQEGIKFHIFKSKLYQLRKEGKLPKRGESEKKVFQEMQIVDTISDKEKSPYCEISFSDTDKITISSKESFRLLRGLFECHQSM